MKKRELVEILETVTYSGVTLLALLAVCVFQRWICRCRRRLGKVKHKRCKGLRVAYLRTDFSAGLKTGGSVSHAEGFVNGLVRTNNTVIVVSSADMPFIEKCKVKSYSIRPCKRNSMIPMTLYVLGYNILFVRLTRKIMMEAKPDVICQRHSVFNMTGLLLSYILGIPFILEYNSSAFWKRESTEKLRLKFLLRAFEQINLHGATKIMVVSQVLRNHLIARGNKAEKIFVNPNGADCELFHPDISGKEIRKHYGLGEGIVVGFTGIYGPWHGVEYLALAAKAVTNIMSNIKFFFVGDQRLMQVVQDITDSANSTDKVVFATGISHSQMPQYLAACDILVSPHVSMADGKEFFGSPVKIFEYMATGCAIVASNIGQLSEIFVSGKNAILVQPSDVEGIAAAITELMRDESLRMHLGSEARRTVVANYTWEHNAKRFEEAFYAQPAGSRKN